MNKTESIYVISIVIIIGCLMFIIGNFSAHNKGYNKGYESSENYYWSVLSEISKNETEFKIENYRWIKIDSKTRNIFFQDIMVPKTVIEGVIILTPFGCIMKNENDINQYYNCYTENNKTYYVLSVKLNKTN